MRKENYLQILQTYLPNFMDKCAYTEKAIVFGMVIPRWSRRGLVGSVFGY